MDEKSKTLTEIGKYLKHIELDYIFVPHALGLEVDVTSCVLNSLRTKNTCKPPLPKIIQIIRIDHR